MRKLSNDAAKLLEAASNELALAEDQQENLLLEADLAAQDDFSEIIDARHALRAIQNAPRNQ